MIQQPVDSEVPGQAFRFLLRGDPQSVRHAVQTLHDTLSRESVLDDDRAIVELVLAEVLNNIVEHAYAGRIDGVIDLTMTLTEDRLACQVTDHGLPFPAGAPPDATLRCQDPEDLPEGGFGWPLIHRLTENLGYRRLMGRNQLSFHLPARRQS